MEQPSLEEKFPSINYRGGDWNKVAEWLARDLIDTYAALASTDTSPQRTEQLRGRASLLAQMLDWEKNIADFQRHAKNPR